MTWACKKSNGTYHDQLNVWGFEEVAGKHFNPTSTAVPVMNDTTTRIVQVLMLLAEWMARIYDVKGLLLKFKFEDGKEMLMEVPQGMRHQYWDLAVLKLISPIHRLKEAALLFW